MLPVGDLHTLSNVDVNCFGEGVRVNFLGLFALTISVSFLQIRIRLPEADAFLIGALQSLNAKTERTMSIAASITFMFAAASQCLWEEV